MNKIARMLRKHRDLILDYFKAKKESSSGVAKGPSGVAVRTLVKLAVNWRE